MAASITVALLIRSIRRSVEYIPRGWPVPSRFSSCSNSAPRHVFISILIRRPFVGWFFHKTPQPIVCFQQSFHFSPQLLVARTTTVQEGVALSNWYLQSFSEDSYFPFRIVLHGNRSIA